MYGRKRDAPVKSGNGYYATYPRGVRALGGALDLPAEPEIGYFAHQLSVDQHVTGGQVSVHVVHFAEILHAGRDAPQHAHQLEYLKFPVVGLPSLYTRARLFEHDIIFERKNRFINRTVVVFFFFFLVTFVKSFGGLSRTRALRYFIK